MDSPHRAPAERAPTFTASAEWTGAITPLVAGSAPPAVFLVPPALVFTAMALVLASYLHINPLFLLVPGLLLALVPATFSSRWSAKRNAAIIEGYPDRLLLRTRKREIALPVDGTKVTLDSRAWNSPRATGQNAWTVLTFEHGTTSLTLGIWGNLMAPGSTRGIPGHQCDLDAFRSIAELFTVELPKEEWKPPS